MDGSYKTLGEVRLVGLVVATIHLLRLHFYRGGKRGQRPYVSLSGFATI